MQTLSSASRTHMAPESASEWTATVAMPISLQARWTRRAISPRLAIRILSNIALLDDDERLAELHRLGVRAQDLDDPAGPRRGDRVHGLHGLDNHQGGAGLHRVANLDEGFGFRLRTHVDGAHH